MLSSLFFFFFSFRVSMDRAKKNKIKIIIEDVKYLFVNFEVLEEAGPADRDNRVYSTQK